MRTIWGIVAVLLLSSCSIAFQDSVRSSGTKCSTSRFWYVADLVLAGATVAAVSANAPAPDESGEGGGMPAYAYAPAALLVGSALIGRYKRNNCEEHLAHATQADYERDARREQEKKAQEAAEKKSGGGVLAFAGAVAGVVVKEAVKSQIQPVKYSSNTSRSSYTHNGETVTNNQSHKSGGVDSLERRNQCLKSCEQSYNAAGQRCQAQFRDANALGGCLQTTARNPYESCKRSC